MAPARRLRRVLSLLVGSLCLAAGSAGAADAAVDVFPIPGGMAASRYTQITFRGIAPSRLGTISVVGSHSGSHPGRLIADSDGAGASFVLTHSLTPGERVTVTAGVALEGGTSHSYQFTVAQPAPALTPGQLTTARRIRGDAWAFQSRPDLTPATVQVTKPDADPGSGDIFTGTQVGPLQNGPMILDGWGNVLWFNPLPKNNFATDVRAQTLNGAPVLTWWQGGLNAGVGNGVDVIDDTHYRKLYSVRAGNGLYTDLHEFQLTPQGTALVTAYYPVYWDLRSVHGPNRAPVLDAVAQEIDIKTGLVLFQWDSLDHVPLTDSYSRYSSSDRFPFDYLHINSVQAAPDGNILISGRQTWAGYDVDPQTAATNWILGGKRSTFAMGSGTQFAWQHDIRMRDASQVTVYDDGAGDTATHKQSRALTLQLDFAHRRSSHVQEFDHSPPILAYYEGNDQLLPDGNTMVGWGGSPYFTEFSPTGSVLLDAHFVSGNTTYRVYRMPWSGTPNTRPAIAAHRGRGITAVYASWNGETAVAAWRILGGASTSKLATVATVPKHGFETRVVIRSEADVAVEALDSNGHVLGHSLTVAPR